MGTAVNPPTIHFMAQMIRHQRAIATSAEKWIQSPAFSQQEALDAVGYFRKVLDAYERSLGNIQGPEQQ